MRHESMALHAIREEKRASLDPLGLRDSRVISEQAMKALGMLESVGGVDDQLVGGSLGDAASDERVRHLG